jgi:cell division protein ZapE
MPRLLWRDFSPVQRPRVLQKTAVMPMEAYAARVNAGELRADDAQIAVIQRLDSLADALEAQAKRGLLDKLFNGVEPPKSIYIHGDVGRGKTMLMDLFFEKLKLKEKRRIHFNAFMQDVHRRRSEISEADVLTVIAGRMRQEFRVLCLDEMQVTDIANAMILGRLFEALLSAGVTIVTTSNRAPDSLYKDGLNRDLFLPAIAMIKERFEVISLDGERDYRLGRVKARETFITGRNAAERLQEIWEQLTDTKKGQPMDVAVLGRKLHVPEASRGCARFTFHDLCEMPLGPGDYLALAQNFQTIFIENIPALKTSQRNEAKRFVLLIDTLYDARVKLVATSAKDPESIYPKGDHRFEFARTVSRLNEMRSAGWWGREIVET